MNFCADNLEPTSSMITYRSLAFPLFLFFTWLLPCVGADAPGTLLDEARAALKASDLPKAAALLAPLTGADDKDAVAFHVLSQVKVAQKDFKAAVEAAEKATTLDATKAAYFSQLGMALGQRMGEINFMQQAMMAGKLKKSFAKSVELDPNHVEGLIGLARYYANAPEIAGGSPEKAREYAVRVQKLDAVLGALEFANIAERGEDYAEALKHYEEAAKLRPTAANFQNYCAAMLVKLGRKEEARARYEAALKLNPKSEAAKKGLAALDAKNP